MSATLQPPPPSLSAMAALPGGYPGSAQLQQLQPAAPPMDAQPAPPMGGRPGPRKPLLAEEHAKLFATWLSPRTRNLAMLLSDADQQALADQAKREYELDDATRAEWKAKYRQWLDFATQVAEEKTYPGRTPAT